MYACAIAVMACGVVPLKNGSHLRVTLQNLAHRIGIIDSNIFVDIGETIE